MNTETEIRNAVVSYSELANNKVFLTTALEGTARPYIVISDISNARRYTHDGYADMTESRYQVDIYGLTYAQVKGISKKLIKIDQYKTLTMPSIEVANMIDGFDNTVNNFTAMIDLMVKH